MHEETSDRDPLCRTNYLRALWLVFLGPALVWLAQFQINYTLVDWICKHGHRSLLTIVNAVALVCAALLALIAWRCWRAAGSAWPGQGRDTATRSQFMTAVGLLASGLFFLAISAQAIAPFFIDPCRQ
jgi:TRAP-type C4-dicarboxylate transport system permease small subunit